MIYLDLCKKCGQCCYLPNGKACQYLDIKTKLCTTYNNRLGKKCEKGFNSITYICKNRLEVKEHYKDCPYNAFISLK